MPSGCSRFRPMVVMKLAAHVERLFVVQASACSSSGRTGAGSNARDRSKWEENTHPPARALGHRYTVPCGDHPETEFPHFHSYDNQLPATRHRRAYQPIHARRVFGRCSGRWSACQVPDSVVAGTSADSVLATEWEPRPRGDGGHCTGLPPWYGRRHRDLAVAPIRRSELGVRRSTFASSAIAEFVRQAMELSANRPRVSGKIWRAWNAPAKRQ
jgi:hypothetical protein